MGAIGEICIAGAGVGLGYIGRDDLTEEVFVQSDVAEGLLYRTGDLGRFCPDGNIEYIGRKDFQVKVRGLRIELGEVENAVKQLDGIVDSVVLVKEESLIAYGVSPELVTPANWQAQLRSSLPDYMVPSQLVVLDQWPLTPNGKVDRKALPAPDSAQSLANHVEPRNELEALIASIWSQVLKIDKVGVEASFFDLGGHSLMIMKVLANLKLAYPIAIQDFFDFQTIDGDHKTGSGKGAEQRREGGQRRLTTELEATRPCRSGGR